MYLLQWGCFKPLKHLNIKRPCNELVENPVPSHFQLLYHKNLHYDCIGSSTESSGPKDFPVVEEQVVDVIIFDIRS